VFTRALSIPAGQKAHFSHFLEYIKSKFNLLLISFFFFFFFFKRKSFYVCPQFPLAVECPAEKDNECETDDDCKATMGDGDHVLKCCLDGCDKRCVSKYMKRFILEIYLVSISMNATMTFSAPTIYRKRGHCFSIPVFIACDTSCRPPSSK